MTTPEAGLNDPRPVVGRSYKERPKIGESSEGAPGQQQQGDTYDFEAHNVEDAYADHIVDYGVGAYPDGDPKGPWDTAGDKLLADNPINPDAAKKNLFVDLNAYEDPATGKPRPSSPVEVLREDLERLQGKGKDTSLRTLVTLSALEERDFGAWQAANDLWKTTQTAKSTLDAAIQRVYTVYASVVQALDETVKTAKAADQSIARDLGTRT